MSAHLATPPPGALRRAACVHPDEAWREWSEVLSAGDGRPPVIALFDEWGRYSGLGYRDMLGAAMAGEEELHEDWETKRPETADEVSAFYDETTVWFPVLLWWHGTARGSNSPARVASGAARVFRMIGATRVLDFGCGVGTTSAFLAERGLEVIAADVSKEALQFTEWRLRERGHDARTVYLRESTAREAGSVDGAVVFDVFEHVHPAELPGVIEDLASLLPPGGVICFNQAFVQEDEPGHFPLRGEPLVLLHERGFRLVHIPGMFWMGQKVRMRPAERRSQRRVILARIRAARAVSRWGGRIGGRISWRVIRYGVS